MAIELWKRTPAQRINDAYAKNEQAKEQYKNQDFKSAGEYYISSIRDVIPIVLQTSEFEEEVRKLKVTCYSNLAACQLKLKQYDRVIINCNKGLELEPDNVKCLYRRATAHLSCEDIDNAEKDVKKLILLEPNNMAFRQLLSSLKIKVSDKNKLDAKFMRMFMNTS
ncbi:uncharacterized protein LOC136087843 [Hydra vulgaris]|uniref:Uncharacterized protein LOC136087843 n=1 Tax=Hydra vulgaris TaxID=6087 RepID=A0ABM4CZW4_HYDVU